MPEEFEGDLAGAVFWGADLSGALLRDVNLTGVTITHAWCRDVEIDALVERLVVNGVDVTAFVNEHDRWYPLRTVLSADDPQTLRVGWAALRDAWAAALARAERLPGDQIHASVGGEWSFVQTQRHLLFVMDKWFTGPILGRSFQPFGLPNGGSIDFPWPDLDRGAAPSVADVLSARAEQARRFADFLADVTPDDLGRTVEVLENGPHPIGACLSTVLEEEFWHLRYADRDLAKLEIDD